MKRPVILALALFLGAALRGANLGTALLVVGNLSLSSSDALLKARVEAQNVSVTTLLDSAANSADALGKLFVMISGSSLSANVGTNFRDVAVPVWVGEDALLDEMNMSLVNGNSAATGTLNLTNPGDFLAGGFSGVTTVYSPPALLNWGTPAASATVVAEEDGNPSHKAHFYYLAGDLMYNGQSAPARRLAFFTEDQAPANLDANGLVLLDRAILWLLGFDAPTATPSATATITPTATSTATPTFTATPTHTPQCLQRVRVLDADGAVARDLGERMVYYSSASLGLSADPFAPEDGALLVQVGGPAYSWDGSLASGEPAPNGQYKVRLSQACGVDVEAPLWLVHRKTWLGSPILAPQPCRGERAELLLGSTPRAACELRLHNLAGERVRQWNAAPLAPRLSLDLRDGAGRPLAPGIYVLVLRFRLPGGLADTRLLKMAVAR